MHTSAAAPELLTRIRGELNAHSWNLPDQDSLPRVPLPSRLAVGELASAAVSSVAIATGRDPRLLSGARISTAYRSDRFLTIDRTQPHVWSPFSGFWQTTDGWLRTHGNYPHHATGLRLGLGLTHDAGANEVARALAGRHSAEAVAAIVAAGGLAVAVTPERPDVDDALRHLPVLDVKHWTTASARLGHSRTADPPWLGARVLDLTRVIAGPVATRTLALLGADVLRIDPPHLVEPGWQHLDTGHGKRTTLLDARSSRMDELLSSADVIMLGYRPAALQRLGLSPETLIERYPGLIVAQLSAWGDDHPERGGFDSLVQAESGIALVESVDGIQPGALPAQALDHSAGYLLATAVVELLRRRRIEGGSWVVRSSLRRIAAELLGMPRHSEPVGALPGVEEADLAEFSVEGTVVRTARPVLPDTAFAPPHRWGSDQPTW